MRHRLVAHDLAEIQLVGIHVQLLGVFTRDRQHHLAAIRIVGIDGHALFEGPAGALRLPGHMHGSSFTRRDGGIGDFADRTFAGTMTTDEVKRGGAGASEREVVTAVLGVVQIAKIEGLGIDLHLGVAFRSLGVPRADHGGARSKREAQDDCQNDDQRGMNGNRSARIFRIFSLHFSILSV